MTLINIKPTHFEPMRPEDSPEQGPHIPPLVRKDVHPQGFEFYKKALNFIQIFDFLDALASLDFKLSISESVMFFG